MQFDNAARLYRKSGVRGTKKRAKPHHCFWHSNAEVSAVMPIREKQWKPIIIVPGTLVRTWGTQRFA
jgi:hypothetical protein